MNLHRQSAIVDANKFPSITVIGAGGIGSFTVLALAKMGCPRIRVYDPDVVEEHNIPNQLFTIEQVGDYKVDAIAETCESMAGLSINKVHYPFGPDYADFLNGIVISGVDSMPSRIEVWKILRMNAKCRLYVDARMGNGIARILSINPMRDADIKAYESSLHTEDEGVQEPCTARGIAYNGLMIAAWIGNVVKKFTLGEEIPREIVMDMNLLEIMKL